MPGPRGSRARRLWQACEMGKPACGVVVARLAPSVDGAVKFCRYESVTTFVFDYEVVTVRHGVTVRHVTLPGMNTDEIVHAEYMCAKNFAEYLREHVTGTRE